MAASKTHRRRVRSARRSIAARMRAAGLDFHSQADRMRWLFMLRERIAARRARVSSCPVRDRARERGA